MEKTNSQKQRPKTYDISNRETQNAQAYYAMEQLRVVKFMSKVVTAIAIIIASALIGAAAYFLL